MANTVRMALSLDQKLSSRKRAFGLSIFIITNLILNVLFWFMIHAIRQEDYEGHTMFCMLFFGFLGATVLSYLNCKRYINNMMNSNKIIKAAPIFLFHMLYLIEWITEICNGKYWSGFSKVFVTYCFCITFIISGIRIHRFNNHKHTHVIPETSIPIINGETLEAEENQQRESTKQFTTEV